MRRSERYKTQDMFSGAWLYDTWPTRTKDTAEGLRLAADLFERDGQPDKAEQVRKGIRAFEGRP